MLTLKRLQQVLVPLDFVPARVDKRMRFKGTRCLEAALKSLVFFGVDQIFSERRTDIVVVAVTS